MGVRREGGGEVRKHKRKLRGRKKKGTKSFKVKRKREIERKGEKQRKSNKKGCERFREKLELKEMEK